MNFVRAPALFRAHEESAEKIHACVDQFCDPRDLIGAGERAGSHTSLHIWEFCARRDTRNRDTREESRAEHYKVLHSVNSPNSPRTDIRLHG